MIDVTEAARKLLSEMLLKLQAPEGAVVRIVASGGGLSLVLGQIRHDDRAFSHADKPVPAVAQGVSENGDNRTLDVVATVRGPKLRVTAKGKQPEPDSPATRINVRWRDSKFAE